MFIRHQLKEEVTTMSSYDYDTNEIINGYNTAYDMSYLGNYVIIDEDIKVNQVEKIILDQLNLVKFLLTKMVILTIQVELLIS